MVSVSNDRRSDLRFTVKQVRRCPRTVRAIAGSPQAKSADAPQNAQKNLLVEGVQLVPGGGIEPPQAFWALRILSPLRLPISPSRLRDSF